MPCTQKHPCGAIAFISQFLLWCSFPKDFHFIGYFKLKCVLHSTQIPCITSLLCNLKTEMILQIEPHGKVAISAENASLCVDLNLKALDVSISFSLFAPLEWKMNSGFAQTGSMGIGCKCVLRVTEFIVYRQPLSHFQGLSVPWHITQACVQNESEKTQGTGLVVSASPTFC